MAYDKEQILKQALKLSEEKKLFTMDDVVSLLPCSYSTFYSYFPAKSYELDSIKEVLNTNKIDIKVALRKKWFKSDNATLQMGLYKLIANDEERKRLTQQYIKHDGEVNHKNQIDATKLKSETLRDLFENGIVENDGETS